MDNTDIDNFADLHDAIQVFKGSTVIFRGAKSKSYTLIPKLGRYDKFKTSSREKEEKMMLRLFKEQAVPYLDFTPNKWEWLAIAQHHGLPTRLLDWSRNPLIAAYFAVEKEHDDDSLIYCYKNNKYINTEKLADPFKRETVGKFIPTHVTQRITAQTGLFTIHPNPFIEFESNNISTITIKESFRKELKKNLYTYGIHRAMVYPSLDGLSKHIEWLRTDVY